MKYIRTKDGRIIDTTNYEVKREIYENGELKLYEFWTTRFTDGQVCQFFTNEIDNQADTIEELCDEFVVITKYGGNQVKRKDSLFVGETGSWTKNIGLPEHLVKIYGAIWTDKGLIYVAKMNEKGELELL